MTYEGIHDIFVNKLSLEKANWKLEFQQQKNILLV
jgi:hypothetical protein